MLSILRDRLSETALRRIIVEVAMWDFGNELSAREKSRALLEAKDYLESVNGDSVIQPTVREVVAAGLSACGYWFTWVGSHREMTTSIEIGRALGLEKGLASVEVWGKKASRETIVAGLDTTIDSLK